MTEKRRNKRYYFLQLPADFFRQPTMKKLRRIAGGDTYTIIYLKMQLLSLENEGMLYYEGLEDDICSELALSLDEAVEDVKVTFSYLLTHGLILEDLEEMNQANSPLRYFLPEAAQNINSITDSALRSRKSRLKQKGVDIDALQCNTNATQLQQPDSAVLHCNTDATHLQQPATQMQPRERGRETDRDIDKERDEKVPTPYRGCLDNVDISEEQYHALCEMFERPKQLIDHISVILPNSRKKENHYAFILKIAMQDNWQRKKAAAAIPDTSENQEQKQKVPMPEELRQKLEKLRR